MVKIGLTDILRKVIKMSDDFCYCSCGTEVQSVYVYDYLMKEYTVIDGYSYCPKCKAVKTKNEVYWRHVEYGVD